MIHFSENPPDQMNKYSERLRVVSLCLTPKFFKAKAGTSKSIEKKE